MKDCTTCKYGYEDERLGIQMCHHPKRFSGDCIDFNMHEEKEIKESEKPVPKDLDFEQELYNHFGQIKDFTLGIRIGQYFYELGKQSGSSETPNDLKEAAEEYIKKGKYLPEAFVVRPAFIAGAKWQAAHAPLPEDTVLFQKGVAEGKRLMMEEAVEGYVNYYEDSGGILMAEAQVGCPYHNGDKVRIIILPKED